MGLGILAVGFIGAILIFYLLYSYQNTKTRVQILAVPDQASAIAHVRALPEVIEYEATLKKAGKQASFEAQEDGTDQWLVQVFEIVNNPGEPSHTATFDWYAVKKKTGKAFKADLGV